MSSQRRLRPSWRALACAAASVLALLLFAGHERAPALFDTEAGWERGAGVEYVARLGESGGHRPRPWQPLIFAPRSWAPGGAYVNEEEEVYFGPLSAHKFAMHPASFADGTAWEVAKLWTAPEAGGAGRASASGVVTLTEPGGAGLLFRLLLGESVLLERAVNDSAPSLDFAGLEFDVSFGDKVAFALSVAGPSHDFCGSWTRFVVKAAGPRRRRGPPRWPRALYAGRGGAGLEGATPLLPPPPAPPPQPPRRCDALLLEGPPARLFCLPTVFIVGAAYCGVDVLARSLLASTRALVPPARPGEPRFFDGAHGVSPAAYAARLGPTDGGATNSTYDASPGYLQSRRAAADVAAAAPSARVLLAVCDPATRLWDAYHGGRAEAAAARRGAPQPEGAIATTVYDLPFPDFVAAVRGAQPQHAGVWDAGLYGRHVRLWAAAVGADRLFLWNRGDYAAAPAATTRTLLAFLRLPPAPGADLDVVVPGAELPQDGAADGGGGGGGGQPRPPPMDAAARDLVAPLYAASWAALLA